MKAKSIGFQSGRRAGPIAFEHRLRAYSTVSSAALAAAAGLALSEKANAQIHDVTAAYFGGTVPSVTLSSPGFVYDGSLQGDESEFGANIALSIAGVFARDTHNSALAANLPKSIAIAGLLFGEGTALLYGIRGYSHMGAKGDFAPVGSHAVVGYVAFKAAHGGVANFYHPFGTNPYYGWFRIKVGASPYQVTFVDDNGDGIYGAYGVASDNIEVGQFTPIPEPASVAGGLALFALGAAGVREMRRRKSAA